MVKKKLITVLVSSCILLCGCGNKAPELLTPIGETEDTALVTRGEMYDVKTYESTVTPPYDNIKLGADGIVGSVDVNIGDKVKAGQVLISMSNGGVGSQVQSIDEAIADLQKENDYMNDLVGYNIEIAKLELQMARKSGDSKKVSDKQKALSKLESNLSSQKIEQEKELAELQMNKLDGNSTQGNVTAPYDGTICYLKECSPGDSISAGTVVAVIAKDSSMKLFGDYIEKYELAEAHRVYGLINEKEYPVTNVPYDQFELASRTFWDLPLYSTFYFDNDGTVEMGMYATIVLEKNYVEDALQIPANALYSDEEGYYVYRITGEDGAYERVNVKVGTKTVTAVEITEGLKEGEEVYVKP